MAEEKIIRDELVHVENETIVLKEHKALLCEDFVLKYLDRYQSGDLVEVKIDPETEKVRFISKAKEKKKVEAPAKPTPAQLKSQDEDEGYVWIDGKKYATLKVLLNKAHELYSGRFSIKTQIVEMDMKQCSAVFMATIEVVNDEGHVITCHQGIGDANSENVNSLIKKSFLRMAETRAVVRALRWLTNIAEASVEELPGEERGWAAKEKRAEELKAQKQNVEPKNEEAPKEEKKKVSPATPSKKKDMSIKQKSVASSEKKDVVPKNEEKVDVDEIDIDDDLM